jgi:peroxiredoxin
LLGGAVIREPEAAPGLAPRFKVKDTRGQTLDLGVLIRKGPVLLDFWATWCKPCHAALPELESWHRRYGARGLTVIGISIDGPRNYSKVRPFVARMGVTYPIVIDEDERLQHLYQVLAVPTAILIDSTGAIAGVRTGYRPGEGAEMERTIRTLLHAPDEKKGASSAPRLKIEADSLESHSPADSVGGAIKP